MTDNVTNLYDKYKISINLDFWINMPNGTEVSEIFNDDDADEFIGLSQQILRAKYPKAILKKASYLGKLDKI